MNESEICKRIYDICLPHTKRFDAPAAYINIAFGQECVINESSLITEFNRVKWDSPLSTAELNITRNPPENSPNTSIIVFSLTYFEDEGVNEAIYVANGKITD